MRHYGQVKGRRFAAMQPLVPEGKAVCSCCRTKKPKSEFYRNGEVRKTCNKCARTYFGYKPKRKDANGNS